MNMPPLPDKLRLLQFETNTACNGHCTFCQHDKMNRSGQMKSSQIIDLLYNFAHISDQCCPFGMQEPTLEPRLSQILSNIKVFNPKLFTILFSNMGVFDKKTWTEIIRWGTLNQLRVSFYGATEQMSNKLQPGLDFFQTRRNIKDVVRLRNKLKWPNPYVVLLYLVTPDTLPLNKKFIDYWESRVDKIGAIMWDNWHGETDYNPTFEEKVWGPPPPRRVPCSRLWSAMYVHYDGTIVPCCTDYDDIDPCGNVFEDKKTWWNSPRLNEIRKLHCEERWDEIPLCKDCTVWRYINPLGNNEWMEFWEKEKAAENGLPTSTTNKTITGRNSLAPRIRLT